MRPCDRVFSRGEAHNSRSTRVYHPTHARIDDIESDRSIEFQQSFQHSFPSSNNIFNVPPHSINARVTIQRTRPRTPPETVLPQVSPMTTQLDHAALDADLRRYRFLFPLSLSLFITATVLVTLFYYPNAAQVSDDYRTVLTPLSVGVGAYWGVISMFQIGQAVLMLRYESLSIESKVSARGDLASIEENGGKANDEMNDVLLGFTTAYCGWASITCCSFVYDGMDVCVEFEIILHRRTMLAPRDAIHGKSVPELIQV